MRTAQIAIETKAYGMDRLYSYAVPESFAEPLQGCRVLVPFGKSNKQIQGIVLEVNEASGDNLKAISSVIDTQPLLSAELCRLAAYIKEHTFCTYFDAVKAMVPVGCRIKMTDYLKVEDFELSEEEAAVAKAVGSLKLPTIDAVCNKSQAEPQLVQDMLAEGKLSLHSKPLKESSELSLMCCSLLADERTIDEYIETAGANRVRHAKVVELLRENPMLAISELCYLAGVSASVPKTLAKRGIIEITEQEIYRSPYTQKQNLYCCDTEKLQLEHQQQAVIKGLMRLYDGGEASAALLNGVTGSGKTVIYISLCDKVMEEGKSAIVLVPEISLTPQFTDRFYKRYGANVAVLHSGLSTGERYDEWRRIKEGKAKIIIGTRSAVFAPCKDLSLIIIDEEQEFTFKSENTPRYHARDVAKFRANENKCLLLLGSATPDIDSYFRAKIGKYSYFELNNRYGCSSMPEVVIADLREDLSSGSSAIIGAKLQEEIKRNLANNEQTILFLNRRGYNTHIGCANCGYVASCGNCSISMTYHYTNDMMMCHYCGKMEQAETACPKCGSKLKRLGFGTQKAEEELRERFPTARILRMDMDTTARKNAHEQQLCAFANGEYDILLGTQMVAKGLDLQGVTLVGVLFADSMIYVNDYRANERAYGMMTQVIGRCGRGDVKGRAVIQTYTPDSPILDYIAGKRYTEFIEEELIFRKLMIFPPFCDIYKLLFVSESENESLNAALKAELQLKVEFEKNSMRSIIMFPASSAPIQKLYGEYRSRILIKCKDSRQIRAMFSNFIVDFNKKNRHVQISIEKNPISIL